jgi:hypothetical protein
MKADVEPDKRSVKEIALEYDCRRPAHTNAYDLLRLGPMVQHSETNQ